jgi:N-acetylglucosamine kinase-like BadF-type ATPase
VERVEIDTGAGLVLGGDVGGTATRLAVADLSGAVVAHASGPGGNPVSHPGAARQVLADTLARALAGLDPAAVRVGVVGMAGGGVLRDPAVRAAYEEVWLGAGLRVVPEVCSDVEVAFAAGTEVPDGDVLIAGTGAVAGRIRGHRLLASTGGHGWLLGDEGSGFWLGREAVRMTLRALDSGAQPGELGRSVLAELGVPGAGSEARSALIAAVHAGPPVALSALAPLVTRAHEAGDREAAGILQQAVVHLQQTLLRLGDPTPGHPVVLAGSLTRAGTLVGDRLRAWLTEQGADPRAAEEPVQGAVQLALRRCGEGS